MTRTETTSLTLLILFLTLGGAIFAVAWQTRRDASQTWEYRGVSITCHDGIVCDHELREALRETTDTVTSDFVSAGLISAEQEREALSLTRVHIQPDLIPCPIRDTSIGHEEATHCHGTHEPGFRRLMLHYDALPEIYERELRLLFAHEVWPFQDEQRDIDRLTQLGIWM